MKFEMGQQPTRSAPDRRVVDLALASAIAMVAFFAMGNAHAKDPGTPTAEHLGLTPAYLQGEWCQTHIQFPKERTEENTPYRWDPDGTYATRGAATAPMQSGFFYLYKPEGKIKLATIAGFFKVKSVKPDAFVLDVFGDMHFRRGPCK
ncbi:hypothetical protein [Hydrogenophaga sp. PAMC20947]|uniref:hypothetical protein n=1 Tax=Hydrogenophaga sp. PAMC20947 TaxID=2565558 RepID=UPI00109DE4CF|nr:hypothetical protein [Hydrogenophaga sp. PAMC20947]QCB47834.1 hypothetical protein E5678_18445 [Hydrogenophaga sp. PAMC20947]